MIYFVYVNIDIYIYMEPKLIPIEVFSTILNNKIDLNIVPGDHAIINFYKISQEQIFFIKNEFGIYIDDDIVVEKIFLNTPSSGHDATTKKLGGKKGQFYREKKSLMLLQNEDHFPIILSIDDDKSIIYMSYCGSMIDKAKGGNIIPNNWKVQIREILSILQNYQIYNNDIHYKNILLKNDIMHLVDFGWATIGSEYYPGHNIIEKDLLEYNDLFDLLNTVGLKTIKID